MLLEARDVTKFFGPVAALRGVSLSLRESSIHAILGENGAGKSTLIKIFSGVYHATSGTLRVKGVETAWADAEQARAGGVSTIFQEFILLPNLSVAENLFLGHEPRGWHGGVDRKTMEEKSRSILDGLGLSIDPRIMTNRLRVADQQMVEIAKGIMRDADIFVFDEPTAALGGREAEQLFRLVRDLKARGKGILYISHRLPELFELCDEVTVLKDGQFAGHFTMADTHPDQLIFTMVGRELDALYPPRAAAPVDLSQPALQLVDVRAEGLAGPVNFSVGRNEIVGLAGLEGQGQIQITRSIFEGRALKSGEIRLFGEPLVHREPKASIMAGIGLIPEDRKSDGLFLSLGVDRNIAAGLLPGKPAFFRAPSARSAIDEQIAALKILLNSVRQAV